MQVILSKMDRRLYPLIAGMLAAGCAHEGIIQVGVLRPSNEDLLPSATVGAGYRGTNSNDVQAYATLDKDTRTDKNNRSIKTDNLSLRFGVGKRFGKGNSRHTFSGNVLVRQENFDQDPVDMFGVGVGYMHSSMSARKDEKSFNSGIRLEAVMGNPDIDSILSLYAGVGF